MRFLFALFAMLSVSLSACPAQFATDRGNAASQQPANDPLLMMNRDIQEARDLLKRLPPSANRDRIELLLTRSELQLKQLIARRGEMPGKRPVSAEDFNRLLISIRNQAFDKDKYTFMETAASGRNFSADQATQILKLFSFDADRTKAAVLMFPHLTDPENVSRLLDAFTFDSSKKNFMERIRPR